MGVVVRRYIDFLVIIITYLYSTCIFSSSIPISLFFFLNVFFILFDWKSAVEHNDGV